MENRSLLSRIQGVEIVKPTDQVLIQLQKLIQSQVIGPGDVLPSELEMAKSFGIGKGYVREALKKLEVYGVVKPLPGVGTIVSDLGKQCINDFITNFVQFSVHDYAELVEVRELIEPFTAARAATNATDEELKTIGDIVASLGEITSRGRIDFQLESELHLEIAKASHNTILASTMQAILPGLLDLLDDLDLLKDNRHRTSHEEHVCLYKALQQRDPVAAEHAMRHHMKQMGGHFSVRAMYIEEKHKSQRMQAR